ncbi:MAG: hypothetical protein SGJ11_17140 [Phycisphaerae bacterium]|nr:hypothetical protein [Phycisphaerae bacterium]
MVVYLLCSFAWIGFDEPLPMTALRLAGVYALANIGYMLLYIFGTMTMGFLTIGIWAVPTMIYIGLLAQIMEVDFEDALIVAIITTVVKIFAVPLLVAAIAGLI